MKRYDMAIIGTGPAGLSAAINAKIRNKDIILLGEGSLSKKLELAPEINNYLGMPKKSGKELSQAFEEHLREMDIEITPAVTKQILWMGEYFSLDTTAGVFEAITVVLGTGVVTAKTLPGEDEYLGNGVGYCATCDGPLYKGKNVAIVADIEEGEADAKYMAQLANRVYYVKTYKGGVENLGGQREGANEDANTEKMIPNLEIIEGKAVEVLGSEGDAFTKRVTGLTVKTGGSKEVDQDERTLEVDGVFFIKKMIPAGSLVPGLVMDEEEPNAIKVNRHMETSLPGLFAAGDCTGKPYQYMKAAGEGLVAGQRAVAYLDALKPQ